MSAAAAANRRRDVIRRMIVRPAAASRVETSRVAASIKVVSRVDSNLVADKKRADRTKIPDAKAGTVPTKAHARFSCKGMSFVSLIIFSLIHFFI